MSYRYFWFWVVWEVLRATWRAWLPVLFFWLAALWLYLLGELTRPVAAVIVLCLLAGKVHRAGPNADDLW